MSSKTIARQFDSAQYDLPPVHLYEVSSPTRMSLHSFARGTASLIDVINPSFDFYGYDPLQGSVERDWECVGHDFHVALEQLVEELRSERVHAYQRTLFDPEPSR